MCPLGADRELKFYIELLYVDIISEQNKIVEHAVANLYEDIHNTFIVSSKKSKTVSFASLIIKYIAICPSLFRFAVKLICCIAPGTASSACCLLKSIASSYNDF